MTNKPRELQELEEAVTQITAANESIRLCKSKIKEVLPKLKDSVASEDERLAIAKYLLEKYRGVYAINKRTVARGVLDCSFYEMEARLNSKPNCPTCGARLKYFDRQQTVKDDYGLFCSQQIPAGWNCVKCTEIPWLKTQKLKDVKSRLLRRFGSVSFSLGEYTYARGRYAIIRIARLADHPEADFLGTAREIAQTVESYLASGDLGFIPMPKISRITERDVWTVSFQAGNKLLSASTLGMIRGLREIEIAPKITGPTEPMPFRFADGAGIVMPLKPREPAMPADFSLVDGQWVRREPR